jgi:hypothetical protein
MDAQTAVDLMVLGTSDDAAVALIDWNRRMYTQTNDERHNDMIKLLVQAIDNTYGVGTYHKYLTDGTLPSDQLV